MPSYPGELQYLAESKTFGVSNKVIVSLRDLPPGRRVTKIMLSLEVAITTAATAAAVLANALPNLIASIVCGDYIRATGQSIARLNWQVRGKMFETMYGVPATNASVFDREIRLMIPFADRRAHEQNDTCRNTELFRNEPLEITFGPLPNLGTGGGSGITGTLRTIVCHEPADAGVIHTPFMLNYEDWNQDDVILRPGVYSDIYVFNEDGTTITDTVLTDATMYGDGELVLPKIQANELCALFNWNQSEGGGVYSASATAPVAGEELEDRPAATAAAGAGVTMNWVPVLSPRPRYKITKLLDIRNALRISFTGSASTFRIGYRLLKPHTGASVAETAVRLGIPDPVRAIENKLVQSKTASKAGKVSARQASILPVRFQAPGSARGRG